jgi:hypothetical protein
VNKYERTLGIGIAAGVIAIILILLSQRGNIDAKVAERLEGMVVEPVTVTEYVTNNVTHTLSLTTTAYVTVTQQPVTRTVVTAPVTLTQWENQYITVPGPTKTVTITTTVPPVTVTVTVAQPSPTRCK